MEIDESEKKVIVRWLVSQSVPAVILTILSSILAYLAMTQTPRFIDAIVQVPVELSKISTGLEKQASAIDNVNEELESISKKLGVVIGVTKETNTMVRTNSSYVAR